MTDKDFAPYQESLELNQLGFDEHCFAWHVSEAYGLEIGGVTKDDLLNDAVLAPTYSQAFRWFREKHNCHHTINLNKKYVGIAYSSVVNFSIDEFNTYEEAELGCLRKLIEIVKEGNK
jgi:hypothetical protein